MVWNILCNYSSFFDFDVDNIGRECWPPPGSANDAFCVCKTSRLKRVLLIALLSCSERLRTRKVTEGKSSFYVDTAGASGWRYILQPCFITPSVLFNYIQWVWTGLNFFSIWNRSVPPIGEFSGSHKWMFGNWSYKKSSCRIYQTRSKVTLTRAS